MASKIQLGLPPLLKIETTIEDLINVSHEIAKHTRQAQVRNALREMVKELTKANEPLIDILAPLCSMSDETNFNKEFENFHTKFKKIYLGPTRPLSTINSHHVGEQLKRLKESKQWMKYIGFSRSVMRLDLLASRWIADDLALADADKAIFDEINVLLDDIARRKGKPGTFKKFKAEIGGIEKQFVSIRDRFADLEVLGRQL